MTGLETEKIHGKNTQSHTTSRLPFHVSEHSDIFCVLKYRYHRFRCFANNKVGQSNPRPDKYHVAMEERNASQQMNTESGDLKASAYSEMPEKKLNNYIDLDAFAGDRIDTANVKSTSLYAQENDSDSLFGNAVTQSKV